MPWGTESDFHGVIDLVDMNAYYWEGDMGEELEGHRHPRGVRERGRGARATSCFEKLAEHDEDLMEKFVHEAGAHASRS